jgi:hypothetical protein
MALVAETSAPSDSSESDKLDEKLTEFCKVPALKPEQVDLNLGDPRSAHAINCYGQKKKTSWWQVPKALQAEEN